MRYIPFINYYCLQKDGVNNISTAKTSTLPEIIKKEEITFCCSVKSFMENPLSMEMYCIRGPKLLIEAAPNITALSNVSPLAPKRQILIPKNIV